MRTFLTLLGLLLLFQSSAQTRSMGVEIGPTFANTVRKDFDHYNSLTALSADLFFEYKKNLFTSTSGIGYMNKGFKQELIYVDEVGNVLGQGALESLRHNYLSISEIVGIEFGEKYFGFSGVGFRCSIYTNSIASGDSFELNDGSTVQGYRWELNYLTPLDFSVLARAGFGMEDKYGNKIYLSATYDHGLSKITDAEVPSRHNNLSVQIGFKGKIRGFLK
ncbi:MAG: hypothetical protein P8P74_03955 [Crocinitomicaceae bacterium]|nr:hypothetical protein [Crocinitomicaceae bacterium]